VATQLLANVLTVTNLAGGASTTLAHGLKVKGQGVIPTQVLCDRASPLVVSAATSTSITVTNPTASPLTGVFRCEYDHSIHAVDTTPVKWSGLPVVVGAPSAIYGSFSDNLDQPLTAGVPAVVRFNTTESANGVSVQNNGLGVPTRLTVAAAGIYEFTISPQLLHTGGGTVTITFWAQTNTGVVPRSASSLEMGNNNNRTLPYMALVLPMNAGDWLEWDFLSTGTNTSLEHFPAAAPIPEIPSVIAGVKLIGV
jgi:hypothetical protein